jgi:hypothetical protein
MWRKVKEEGRRDEHAEAIGEFLQMRRRWRKIRKNAKVRTE